jgi:hypothetical protein
MIDSDLRGESNSTRIASFTYKPLQRPIEEKAKGYVNN